MREQFGKVNTLHAHVLPWVDEPLVMKNLLGGEEGISDSGHLGLEAACSTRWFFLEATGEVYQGNAGLFQSHERSDVSYVGRLRGYRDITEATNLDLGVSFAHGHNDAGPDFTTRLFSARRDVRYRPLRRAIYHRFIGRTELFWSNAPAGRRRRLGVRDVRERRVPVRAALVRRRALRLVGARDRSVAERQSGSALLTYWPSEFSQVRGQYRRTRLRGRRDRQRVAVPVPVFDRRARRARVLGCAPSSRRCATG